MKKFLSLFLCLILLLALLPLSAPARADSSGDWEYDVYSDYTSISKYSGAGGKATIPSTLGGKPVKEIGYYAFQDCTGLTSVTIPSSVTSIGDFAFSGCTGLTSISIPDSVTEIGRGAFSRCTCLTGASIPDSVTSINDFAFQGCTGLTSVTIPSSVTSIGSYAFQGCTGLTSMTIPSSVIGWYAFSDCTGLTSVTIPGSVTSIGSYAFQGCTGLTSVTIPSSVTNIGGSAFSGCTGLTSISIPDNVTEIGSGAFSGCTSLTKINTAADNPSYCSIDGILFSKDKATLIQYPAARTGSYTIPNSVIRIGSSAFSSCAGLTSVTIPSSVASIGDSAFSGCTGLTSVTIPDSVTSIGISAFYGCTGLTSVTIPSSVTGIGYHAFQGCTGLTSVTIPSSVTSIGGYAFSGCTGLTSVTIPSSVASIGYSAFSGCTGLTSISIPDSVTEIGSGAFSGCTSLTKINTAADNPSYCSIDGILFSKDKATLIQYPAARTGGYTIPNSVTSIGYSAFSGCTGLTSVTIPNSVAGIGNAVFSGCTGLTSVTIPNSVASIGGSAFSGCTCLTGVSIPDSVTSINDFAFRGCSGLTSVTIPSSVTSIGTSAFYNCSGLTSVTIPGSVASIGWYAFYGCTGLTDVYYGGTEEEWGGIYIDSNNGPLTSAAIHYAGPLVLDRVKANKTTAKTGEKITWTATASGGAGTLQYYFIVYKDGTKVKTRAYSTANTFSYTPAEAGTYKARVYVKDSTDAKVNKLSAGVAVSEASPPTITSIAASKTTANVGSPITWTATASGGSGTLLYYFIVYKDGTKVKTRAYSTANTFSYTPTEAGTYKARVYVKDSTDAKVNKLSAGVAVSEASPPSITSIAASKTTANVGSPITWTATATGGTGTLQYYFILYKDGTKVKTRSYSTTNTFSYTPTEAGTYKVRVYVKDAEGAKVNKLSAAVTVTG